MELRRVDESGLLGVLASEDLSEPKPGIIVFGGSDGGTPQQLAAAVAARGFTGFGLAYFGVKGLPRSLVEVPLEYVERALNWFCGHSAADGGTIGALGASKGAELALLTGATFPGRVSAVAAFAPSSVVFAGIDRFVGRSKRSSWSHGGRPLPFVPYQQGVRPTLTLRGMRIAPMYDAALDNLDAVRDAAIPVELINGPIMLVSGDNDRMWPSTRMAEMITRRLAEHGRADRVTHLRYQGAGHALSRQGRAAAKEMGIRGRMMDLGGTMDADAAAGDDAWPKLVEFMLAASA